MTKYAKFDEDEGAPAGAGSPKKSQGVGGGMNTSSSKYATFDNAICDDDDESVNELNAQRPDSFGVIKCSFMNPIESLKSIGNTLLFFWIQPLLKLGNSQPLNLTDLYDLESRDQAYNIYEKFYTSWQAQLQLPEPSLAWAFVKSFGTPFFMAGGLKLIHDCLIFVGPVLLNRIIVFLDNPDKPVSLGLSYVLALFISQVIMSICLRQYFFWCFRCGMWLRSAVVTSVFAKSLLISAGVLGRRTVGEISNLMSVDSTRLQSLTPYLHAIWYSFLQIALALYFLWGQVGPSCLGGISIIILVIPVTKKVSKYLGGIQKQLSKIRDRRVKLSSEVIGGMKVIKFQAWEKEFHERVNAVRDEELAMYRKYIIANCFSSVVYTAVPLLVSISTFIAYVGSGHELDVATALTSLALFEILRFPLFMLPNVLNNVVEAKVSVDRVGSFLLETEKKVVTPEPLWLNGIQFDSATLVYESVQCKMKKPESELNSKLGANCAGIPAAKDIVASDTSTLQSIKNKIPFLNKGNAVAKPPEKEALTELEFELVVRRAQVRIAENHIRFLEEASNHLHGTSTEDDASKNQINALEEQLSKGESKADSKGDRRLSIRSSLRKNASVKQSQDEGGRGSVELSPIVEKEQTDGDDEHVEEAEDKILTLYRVSMAAQTGNLLCIVGKVGSGKSSCLNALLGDMMCVLGKVSLRGSVSYVAQRPFIQNSTLKDNILFGRPLDEKKYQNVLKVCALVTDLKVLPAGDQTEIGERGINLSGGQKARVALARAVYADTDIVLLDDPLAAVDAHVAQHLFDSCIVDTLLAQNKCVILVTNALQFIKDASQIVVLQDGCVVESGTYSELYDQHDENGDKSGGQFYDMMKTHMEGLNTADAARSKPSLEALSTDVTDPSLIPILERLRSNSATGNEIPLSNIDLLNDDNDNQDSKSESSKNRSRTVSNMSEVSVVSTGSGKNKPVEDQSGVLTKAEDREVGKVTIDVYKTWARAAGGVQMGVAIIVLFVFAELIQVLASFWLSYWSAHREDHSAWFYLYCYIGINVGVLIAVTTRDLVTAMSGWKAGKALFGGMLSAVLYAPMSFFDTTPMGRILNRFSKDVETVDTLLPRTVKMYLGTMGKVISTLLYICVVTPFFLLFLFPILYYYYRAQQYFIKTSRELTRLDSLSRSPIYALFAETLDGLSTIRAFGDEARLTAKSNKLLDSNQQAYFLNFSANCWLAVRLELAGACIVTFTALSAVFSRQFYTDASEESRHQFAGMAGLAISLALGVTQSLNWSVRMASDLESQMVAVERLENFADMEQEADHETSSQVQSSIAEWPNQGDVVLKDVSFRYRPNLPLVLNKLNVHILPREKVGIVVSFFNLYFSHCNIFTNCFVILCRAARVQESLLLWQPCFA